jgi:hypothetical protein
MPLDELPVADATIAQIVDAVTARIEELLFGGGGDFDYYGGEGDAYEGDFDYYGGGDGLGTGGPGFGDGGLGGGPIGGIFGGAGLGGGGGRD